MHGTQARPRVSVFRSNAGMQVQIIDDDTGKTIVAVSSNSVKEKKGGSGLPGSTGVGKKVAAEAKKLGKIVATVLYMNAARVPTEISVFMSAERWSSCFQAPRWNCIPAQNNTGMVSTSWT